MARPHLWSRRRHILQHSSAHLQVPTALCNVSSWQVWQGQQHPDKCSTASAVLSITNLELGEGHLLAQQKGHYAQGISPNG